MESRVPIQETCIIPSRGKVYSDMEVPEQFTLRAMTTVEEKMRLSGQGIEVIPKLIQACTVEPEKIDVSKLKMFDIQFLMYKLRTVTYGSDYEIEIRCPHCGATKRVTINLDEIHVNYLDEEPNLVFGPLPVSGDMIECKALSAADYAYIAREAKRIKNKFLNYVGDPEIILTLQTKILKVNGEDLPANMSQKYVETMHMRDVRYLESKYEDALGNIGLDTDMTEVCDDCGSEFEFTVSTDSDFFRPRY